MAISSITKVELLSSDAITKPIYERLTMILAIIMVFYVTFELVQYIIEPDNITDKEKGAGKIAYKMIIVILLIAFVPTIFTYAYKLQNTIIETQVIPKIILGKTGGDPEAEGRQFATNMFMTFYRYDKEYWLAQGVDSVDCNGPSCETVVNNNLNALLHKGSMNNITYGLKYGKDITVGGYTDTVPGIRFDGLIAIVVGGFIIYILILYSMDLGARLAQLLFLQVIAPIPIIGFLAPKKDNMFDKWVKQCITTYLDVFIRLALIYLVIFLAGIIGDAYNNGQLLQNVNPDTALIIYLAIIIGLLTFAQKAPKLLEELFPKMGAASGNFGLKFGERVDATRKAARSLGRVLGGTTGAVLGFAGGLFHGRGLSGMVQGAITGSAKDGNMFSNVAKANKNLHDKINRDKDIRHEGGSVFKSRFFPLAEQSAAKSYDRRTADLETYSKKKSAVEDSIKDLKFMKQFDSAIERAQAAHDGAKASQLQAQRKKAQKLAAKYAAGDTSSFSDLQTLVDDLITTEHIKDDKGDPITSDKLLEIDANGNKSSKWSKVKTNLEEAHKAATEIADEDIGKGEGKISKKRKSTGAHAKLEDFADEMGDIDDDAKAALEHLKSRDRYKEAEADAKAAGGK